MSFIRIFCGIAAASFVAQANAALIDRGGGFIYDDVLDITWTQTSNINGLASWDDQVAWADSLSIYDSVRDVTWDGWRLASMDVNGDATIVDCSTAAEVDCRDNEYGYLFHQYSVNSATPGPFSDVVASTYWSGTESTPPGGAYNMSFSGQPGIGGFNGVSSTTNFAYAWAVLDGDVAVVPVPAAMWLFGSALGLLGWIRRKAN